jgi:glutamate/tyrosine decarboxylase-like PLP-dependent enzyme
MMIACRWCGRLARPSRHGSPRVFCSPRCRVAFHSAARRWSERLLAAGRITVADLRADPEACALFWFRDGDAG